MFSSVVQWRVVDLLRERVGTHIRRRTWVELHRVTDGEPIAVPLSTRAVAILKDKVGEHEEFVFTYLGRAISEIKTAFIAACIRAGLGEYVDGEDKKPHYQGFTWHGLRHTWATWHIQNGTPTEVLQKLGAWADHRMVMNYAHHSAGYLAQFADNAGGRPAAKKRGR